MKTHLIVIAVIFGAMELFAVCNCWATLLDEESGAAFVCSKTSSGAAVMIFAFTDKPPGAAFYDPYAAGSTGEIVTWRYTLGDTPMPIRKVVQMWNVGDPSTLAGDFTHREILNAIILGKRIRFRFGDYGTLHTFENCTNNKDAGIFDNVVRRSEELSAWSAIQRTQSTHNHRQTKNRGTKWTNKNAVPSDCEGTASVQDGHPTWTGRATLDCYC